MNKNFLSCFEIVSLKMCARNLGGLRQERYMYSEDCYAEKEHEKAIHFYASLDAWIMTVI